MTRATTGDAWAAAHDPKMRRTKTAPELPYCRVCHGKQLPRVGHSVGCPHATMEDAKKEIDRARKDEQWARDRAAFWLGAVRDMHGKLAMLKHENKRLKERMTKCTNC